MKNPKITVIIPVYNGSKYLYRCIKALTDQSLQDIEIIIVNDGSKDNSSAISHNLEKKDNRIIVIDKENEGVSVARNKGLEIAKGEWIAFSDVDDYYLPDGLENLYRTASESKCRIILGNTNRIAQDGLVTHRYPTLKTGQIYRKYPNGSLEMWGDLFHHSLFQPRDYIFTTGLAYLEDRLLMVKLLSKEGQYSACEIPVYTHVKNDDSVLESKDGLRMARHCFWASKLMLEHANNAAYFRGEVICDGEQARFRGVGYFLQKKNAPFSELRKVYSEYFGQGYGLFGLLLKVKLSKFKKRSKQVLNTLICYWTKRKHSKMSYV